MCPMHLSFHILMQNRYHCGMNFRHLRAFVTIVDIGGFARAAARLNVSQPALSRQIHALEAELGVPLFDRIGRRVQLTSEGEDLLRRSRRLLAEADSLGERARSLKSGETGILRVGATPQVIENLLADFLTRYRRRHPGVEVHLVEDGGARLLGRLERGDVHLTMTAAGGTRFQDRLLYPMHVLAVLSRRTGWAAAPCWRSPSWPTSHLLLLRRDFGSREWFDAACQVAHIRPRVLLESAAPHTLVALAATDYGIAMVPSNAQVPRGIVRAVPLVHRGASVGRWSHIAWDPHRFLAPYAEQFVEELVDLCPAHLSGPRARQPRSADPATERGAGWFRAMISRSPYCVTHEAGVSYARKNNTGGRGPCGVQDSWRCRSRPSQHFSLESLVTPRTGSRSRSAGAASAKPSSPRSATRPVCSTSTASCSIFSIPTAAARPSRR